MKNGLMITLDDAMKVLVSRGFLGDGYSDKDGQQYVRQELEQKCYILHINDAGKDALFLIDLINLINPEEIAKNIVDGMLREWCKTVRDNLTGRLELLSREKHGV